VRNILLRNGEQIQIYARVSSLQESKTTAQEFITEANQSGCQFVVFCLLPQPNPVDPVQYPDASTYLSVFIAEGWDVVKVAVLGQAHANPPYPQQAFFPNSQTDPINQTAQAVRLHFEWQ
jgi:hypothetical protein